MKPCLIQGFTSFQKKNYCIPVAGTLKKTDFKNRNCNPTEKDYCEIHIPVIFKMIEEFFDCIDDFGIFLFHFFYFLSLSNFCCLMFESDERVYALVSGAGDWFSPVLAYVCTLYPSTCVVVHIPMILTIVFVLQAFFPFFASHYIRT